MKPANWDKYRRMQCNIDKAIFNPTVSNLMNKHYNLLHSDLVATDEDEAVFNDTFLKLTYNFNPDSMFIDQFRYYFSLLKGAYSRDSRVNCLFPLDEEKLSD